MASPFQTQLPPWVVNSGQQTAWNVANPAMQKDWMKQPAWRPRSTSAPSPATVPSGSAPTPAPIPGTTSAFPNPNEFKSYEDWVAAGLAGGGNEWHLRNPTILSPGVKQMWGLAMNFRDPRWEAMQRERNPALAKEFAGEQNALAYTATHPITPQTPWFQNPWGVASKSKELPYYMGKYGRG